MTKQLGNLEEAGDAEQDNSDARIQRVLDVLDSDIQNIRDAHTQQGWSSWGLAGAIIAALWLLSDELKSGIPRIGVVATSVFLFVTLIDSSRWLIHLLLLTRTPRSEPVRFKWSNELFSGSELVFIIEILRSIALLVFAFLFAPKGLPLLTLSVAYAWYLTMAVLWLTLTLTEFPVRQGINKKGLGFILAFIIPCLTSFFLFLRVAPFPIGEVLGSYRTGGLVVVISYLILLVGMITKDSAVLQSLIQTRRNIAFNRVVDIRSAINQAEFALSGMEAPEAVRKDIESILQLMGKLNDATNNLVDKVQAMRTSLPEPGDSSETLTAKINVLTEHRRVADSILSDRQMALTELNSRFQQLMQRRQRIQAVIPEAVDYFDQLDSRFNTILEESNLRFNQFVEEANKYDEQLEVAIRAAEKR